MACYTPIPAYWERFSSEKIKSQDVWRKWNGAKKINQEGMYKKIKFVPLGSHNIMVPCSKCIGCKLDRCTQWALRCTHESKLYDSNYFVTLTFKDSPVSCSVRPFQKFMKRLRKWCDHNNKPSPRYFHATEYGSKRLRPHHHAILFNLVLDDLKLFRFKKSGNLYTSETLSRIWGQGHVAIGAVTHDSIAYVAAYTLMKDTNKITTLNGEILEPETMTCSRGPSIGLDYFLSTHIDHAVKTGFCMTDKYTLAPIPRSYMNWLKENCPNTFDDLKLKREARAYERKLLKQEMSPEMRIRNLRRMEKQQKAYVRGLDKELPAITLESIRQFRRLNLQGELHETVLNS